MRRVASCAQLLRRSGFRRLVIDSLFRIVVLCECTACHSLPRNICASLTKKGYPAVPTCPSNNHNDTVGSRRPATDRIQHYNNDQGRNLDRQELRGFVASDAGKGDICVGCIGVRFACARNRLICLCLSSQF